MVIKLRVCMNGGLVGVIPVPTYFHLAKKNVNVAAFAGSYEITLKTAGWHEWRVGGC